jgi:hypothetical protein
LVREGVEELERREQQLSTAVDVGFREAVEKAALGRGKGGAGVEGAQPFEREGRAGTVADEAFDARPILALDTHRSVDAEPARALPGEHAGGVDLVEESVTTEVAKDTSLEDRLQLADVIGGQLEGLVEFDLAAAVLAENAVEDGRRCPGSSARRGRWSHPDEAGFVAWQPASLEAPWRRLESTVGRRHGRTGHQTTGPAIALRPGRARAAPLGPYR